MNVSPRRIILRILAVGTLFGAGVLTGQRLSEEPVRETTSVSRYKAGLRLLMTPAADESRQLHWRDEHIKMLRSRELGEAVLKELKLPKRWAMDEPAAQAKLSSMMEVHVERDAPHVLVVTVRSADKNEPEAIADSLARTLSTRLTDAEMQRTSGLSERISGKIKDQEAAVEKAREVLVQFMAKHNVPGFGSWMPEEHRNVLEKEVSKLSMQFQALSNLDEEKVFAGALALGIQDATITKVYPEYLELNSHLSSLLQSGFGTNHPEMKGLRDAITTKYTQLETAVESYKSGLQVQLETSKLMLANADATIKDSEKQKLSEYTTAKNSYETQLRLLKILEEDAARESIDEPDLPLPDVREPSGAEAK